MAKATYVPNEDFKHVVKSAAAGGTSQFPFRDVALLNTAYGTGMMVTEMAKLPLTAYLNADGSVREESAITPDIAYNGVKRPLYWNNKKVIEAIESYLEVRIARRHGITTKKAGYRGLDPLQPLFLTDEGTPYKLQKRETATGAVSYACDSLSQLFRSLHTKCGVEGVGAQSARRTFAVNLSKKNFDLKHIRVLLGLQTLRAAKNLVDADPVRLGRIAGRVF